MTRKIASDTSKAQELERSGIRRYEKADRRRKQMKVQNYEIWNAVIGTSEITVITVGQKGKIVDFIRVNKRIVDDVSDISINVPGFGEMYGSTARLQHTNSASFRNYMRTLTAEEIDFIKAGIAETLNIEHMEQDSEVKTEQEEQPKPQISNELIEARTKAEIYEQLYRELLNKMGGKI